MLVLRKMYMYVKYIAPAFQAQEELRGMRGAGKKLNCSLFSSPSHYVYYPMPKVQRDSPIQAVPNSSELSSCPG